MVSVCLPAAVQAQPSSEHSFPQTLCTQSASETDGIVAPSGSYNIDADIHATFSQLLRLYSMHVNRNSDVERPVVSGGLQQYMTKKSLEKLHAHQGTEDKSSEVSLNYNSLPVCIQLQIASYLDTDDLCRMARVCWAWYSVMTDNLLWQQKMERDVHKWNVIGHSTNPSLYKECQSDWSNKQIYLRCSPQVNQQLKQNSYGFHQISSILRSFWPKKTPKLAMFGPGLESSTRFIVRKIIEDTTNLFKRIGMFPGQFGGIGSGFTLKMNSLTFQLTTLYTATRAERLSRGPQERLQNNRLLEGGRSHDEGGEPEMRQPVKDLCRTLDGFIFVVDATLSKDSVQEGRKELLPMVNELWSSPHLPVLILSCVPDSSHTACLSCMEVVEALKLGDLNRPWQVHQCVVDSMDGLTSAFEWAVLNAQRNS